MTTIPVSKSKGFISKLPFSVQQEIKRRRAEKLFRERQQKQLIPSADIFHNSIAGKLASLGVSAWEKTVVPATSLLDDDVVTWKHVHPWLDNFMECGHHEIFRNCKCCGQSQTFKIGCSLKWCPRCSWKISKRREEKIRVWAKRIRNPIHVVLTQKNFPVLTRRKLKEHIGNLQAIRRTKVFSSVAGGCTTVEITNIGNGWHLHSHWLVDAKKIDSSQLAIAWGKQVGQEFAIVKAKPLASSEYVSEICKYVAKGNEIAGWSAEQIFEFATAIRGRRFFFSFGNLTKMAKEIREQIAFEKPEKKPCDCGESNFKFAIPDKRYE